MKRWPWRLGRAAVQGAITGIEESFVRTLAKVVPIMPPHVRRRVDALRAMTMPAPWSTASTAPSVDPATRVELQTTTPWGVRATRQHQYPPGPSPARPRSSFKLNGACQSGWRRTCAGGRGGRPRQSCVRSPFGEGGYSVTPGPVAGSHAASTAEADGDLVRRRQSCAGRQRLTDGQVRVVALSGFRIDQPAVPCGRPGASAHGHG